MCEGCSYQRPQFPVPQMLVRGASHQYLRGFQIRAQSVRFWAQSTELPEPVGFQMADHSLAISIDSMACP